MNIDNAPGIGGGGAGHGGKQPDPKVPVGLGITEEPTGGRQKRTRVSNGEATILERADGWHAWVTVGTKPDGRLDRRHRRGRTRAEVVRKVKDLQRAKDAGNVPAAGQSLTLAQWLHHWIRNVAPATLRRKSLASYRTDVTKHLVPGLGRHRLNKLTTMHIEAFYGAMARETTTVEGVTRPRYRPATIDHVHRTLRSALRDAVEAGLIPTNPAARAKRRRDQSLQSADHSVEPFDVDAARAIIEAAKKHRNGVRYILALSHGLRQGEALGLPWSKVTLDGESPMLAIEQQLQRHSWLHGCGDELPDGGWPCGTRRGADCPNRHSGGLVLTQVKSRKGERYLALDPVTTTLLRAHKKTQAEERLAAGTLWHDHGLVFTQPNGRPLDPRADSREWHALLQEAGVKEARLHDARHTAATFLLVQGVDPRVVMDLMGWSSAVMLKRYQHVIDQLRRDAATRVANYLHGTPANGHSS